MARLQILELPEGTGDDRPPFILVVDQVPTDEAGFDALRRDLGTPDDLLERIGARAVLVFEDTIDIPANDTSAYLGGSRDSEETTPDTVRLHVEGDFEKYREQVREEIQYAMGKTTRALAGEALGAARTDIARDMDRLAKWKNELTDALGMDRTRDWDDIRNAAAGLRKERDSWAASAQRVRDLHRPVEHRGQTICWACSDYDFPGQTTDSPPVAYDQCLTIKALTGYPAADA